MYPQNIEYSTDQFTTCEEKQVKWFETRDRGRGKRRGGDESGPDCEHWDGIYVTSEYISRVAAGAYLLLLNWEGCSWRLSHSCPFLPFTCRMWTICQKTPGPLTDTPMGGHLTCLAAAATGWNEQQVETGLGSAHNLIDMERWRDVSRQRCLWSVYIDIDSVGYRVW